MPRPANPRAVPRENTATASRGARGPHQGRAGYGGRTRDTAGRDTPQLPPQIDHIEARRAAEAPMKAIFLQTLETTMGIVSPACKACNITWGKYRDWLDTDEEFRQTVNDISEMALDFAETSLFKSIKAGDVRATTFYLKTKGRRRGFTESVEVTGKDGAPVAIDSVVTFAQVQEELPESAARAIFERLSTTRPARRPAA